MLTEIAMTPHVFDAASNPDTEAWLECLGRVGQGFFPLSAPSPVIAANLQDGGWIEEVKTTIGRITDHRVRVKAQQVASRLKDIVVSRPTVNYWPDDEKQWAEEAVGSHRAEPIGRIVMTDRLHQGYQAGGVICHALQSVCDDGFWTDIRNARQVPMDIPTQVGFLRPICVHSQYLALKLPHAEGSDDDETPFAAEVIGSAFRRPRGFPAVKVELHINGERYRGNFTSLFHNIRHSLATKVPAGGEVLLCAWRGFIDRKLIAGVFRESAGQLLRSPRWGVGFQHVARPHDNRPPTGWWLISKHDFAEISGEFDASNPAVLHQEVLRF